jgi:hypothetical protein
MLSEAAMEAVDFVRRSINSARFVLTPPVFLVRAKTRLQRERSFSSHTVQSIWTVSSDHGLTTPNVPNGDESARCVLSLGLVLDTDHQAAWGCTGGAGWHDDHDQELPWLRRLKSQQVRSTTYEHPWSIHSARVSSRLRRSTLSSDRADRGAVTSVRDVARPHVL